MHILLLTQWFQPEGAFKGLPFAKALRAKGHDVEVLTGFPNYPGGKVYPGYRVRLYQREEMDGIRVHRVALYPSHDTSALHRILNYLSFAFSAFVIGPWTIRRPDVIYVYNLVTLGPPAFLCRLLFGAKVLLDVQDLWPESVTNSRMLTNKTALGILNKICNWVYSSADRLSVLSPGFKKELVRRGLPPEKIEVIYNWFDETSIEAARSPVDDEPAATASKVAHSSYVVTAPIETAPAATVASFALAPIDSEPTATPDGAGKQGDFAEKFVVLFAGAMGLAQGLDAILDCASLCEKTLPDVHFVLIGGGVDKRRLQKRAEEMALANVTFLPPRPQSAMGEIYALADALLVHLKDDPLFRITIPSKTQAYLYIGKPLIMALRGDAADLVHKSGAGVVCAPEDPPGLLKAIEELREMTPEARRIMGQAGHRFYMQHLSFPIGVGSFEQLMASLVEASG